ncbi:hypothetical protein J421_2351 [Gemmatirosa kalamazoonensis]|uniref:Uncharacterized protein n=1 Tax=Gemmatirosa kalamazoonensis TaxID=861299 RepID=W0RKC6_9BACT|nr:hypothetical protein [Gemmatirosa kalamazoonensis]AHG89888.1 hypothetical protein J421_2351 [Gemmatirosa kalamazoonensis]
MTLRLCCLAALTLAAAPLAAQQQPVALRRLPAKHATLKIAAPSAPAVVAAPKSARTLKAAAGDARLVVAPTVAREPKQRDLLVRAPVPAPPDLRGLKASKAARQ